LLKARTSWVGSWNSMSSQAGRLPELALNIADFYLLRERDTYVLLKPFRLFETVNEPSCCATTLIQYAGV
jgi:hypothetical protein